MNMKALIRREGETVAETDGIEGIDWNTGYPLTGPNWFGGPYTLVQNYVPPTETEPEQYEEIVEPTPTPAAEEPEVEVVPDSNVIIIDGKEYTKEELRALLDGTP